MNINLKQLKSLSIWTSILQIIGVVLIIAYFIFKFVNFGISQAAINDISTVLIIVFSVFLGVALIVSILISICLYRKSPMALINIIPFLFCIPAIMSCSKYIREWQNQHHADLNNQQHERQSNDLPISGSSLN